MVTVRTQYDLAAAIRYFKEHLRQGNTLGENQQLCGCWHGHGAIRLGLDPGGTISEEEFSRICNNQHPITGEKLTARNRHDRRIYYDFVISAPKSVSIVALVMEDARVLAAHQAACLAAMQEAEKAAAVRVRRNGQRSARLTGEVVAAYFDHDCSRSLDPQLHRHFLVFNATYDLVEQAWRALEPENIFEQCRYLTEVYRNVLAARLLALGYRLRSTANGFEIDGVSEEVIARLSKRRRTILDREAELEAKLGRRLTNNGRASVARATRERKRRDLGSEELLAHQREQLSAAELAALARVIPGERSPSSSAARVPSIGAGDAIRQACDHVFERLSVASEHELLSAALRLSRGLHTCDELRAALHDHPQLLWKEDTATTVEAAAAEKRLINLVNTGIGSCPALNRGFAGNEQLSDEQRQAVSGLLRSTDGVMALRGGAGTGKTFTLQEVGRGITQRNKIVLLLAPTGSAVEVLRTEGFPTAQTVQRFLMDPTLQERFRGQVLIVDEAGLLSVRQMLNLVEESQRLGCRVILCGDPRQHSSVEAGDALRILQQRSHLRTVQLNQIRRQVRKEYREAIAEIASGQPRRALDRLEQIGAVSTLAGDARHQQLAADYVASLQAGKTALIVAPTWREITDLTPAVRDALRSSGMLAKREVTVETHVSTRWTHVEKRDLERYQSGQVVTFHTPTRDFERGEWARVVKVAKDRLRVRKPSGQEVTLTRKQSGCYDVADAQPLAVATGDRLLLQASRRESRLLNGQLVTVKTARRDGRIVLTDGRVIPPDFRRFTHGYCLTSPSAQGKTADHVYLAVDAQSGQAVNLKQFYVSTSRGREQVKIYTDDTEVLRRAIERSGNRQSALELIPVPDPGPSHARRPGIKPG